MGSSFIHISDLHFSHRNDDQSTYLRRAFLKDLRERVLEFGRPEFIVFSGDIVHNPDEPDVYLYAVDSFIDPVSHITGINPAEFIICPGNHDVSRSAMKNESLSYEGIVANRGDPNYFGHLYNRGALQPYAYAISSKFFEFCDYLGQPWSDPLYKLYCRDNFAFLSLNSSFSCSLDGSAADRGKLFFPISAFESAIAAIPDDRPLGIVNHFSVEEFDEPHARIIRPALNRARVVFYGHVHMASPQGIVSANGNHVSLQAGALYEHDDDFRGYSYSFVKDEAYIGVFRTYYKGRDAFDEATNVAARGMFFHGPSANAYWQDISHQYTARQLSSHLRDVCLPELISLYDKALLGRRLSDTYVFPNFEEADLSNSDEDGEPLQLSRSQNDILTVDDNICLHFPDETGATSLLHYVALRFSTEPDSCAKPRIPIYVDIRDKKGYEATVIQTLRIGLPAVDHPMFGWSARKTDQPFVVLIDNYSPENPEHNRWLRTAHSLLPKARFIVCAKSPLAMQGGKSRTDIDLPFASRSWNLIPFNRRQVRMLVNKFDLPPALDRNLIVEEIRSKFRALGIPLSGPFIAIYLSILSERKKYAPINAAAVIENFVEVSLEKASKDIIYQDDFDYNEQIDVLSYCAEHYSVQNVESLEYSSLYDVFNLYYSDRGIKRNIPLIISYFITKGIFEDVSNHIFIKYRIVYSYLLAKRIQNSSSFRSYVFSDLRFLQYVQELDIYFGINRQDEAALAVISAGYSQLEAAVIEQFGPYVDIDSAASVTLPKSDELDDFMGRFADRIVETHQDEQRDADVEASREKPAQFVQRMRRPQDRELLIRWVKALAAYSVCIKNSESLTAPVKKDHLERIINGWGMLSGLSFKVVAHMFEGGVVKIGPYEFNFGAQRLNDPRMVRLVIANIPRYVSYFTNIYLSSGKLQEILKSLSLTEFPEFLRVSLLVDMRADGFLHTVLGYEKLNRANPTLLEAMLWKLRDSFLRYGLAKGYINQFKQIIGELTADVSGERGEDRDRHIASVIQRIGDQKLARRFSGND